MRAWFEAWGPVISIGLACLALGTVLGGVLEHKHTSRATRIAEDFKAKLEAEMQLTDTCAELLSICVGQRRKGEPVGFNRIGEN